METQPALSESELMRQLTRDGLYVTRWSNGPHAVYGAHEHPYGKVLVVISGSITLTIERPTRVVQMRAGDRLNLTPHIPHSAVVGPDGVVCLEAHVPLQHTL